MLGQTDITGQLNKIKLTKEFLDRQIAESIDEERKNTKLYKSLGAVCGLMLVIILV